MCILAKNQNFKFTILDVTIKIYNLNYILKLKLSIKIIYYIN